MILLKQVMSNLIREVDQRLKSLNAVKNQFDSVDFVVPHAEKNALVVKEAEGESEVAVFLKQELLTQLQDLRFPHDFDLSVLPDLSVIIEELSHFNYYCDRALRNIKVSSLELELQAEVDKFAFALDCLDEQNETHLKDELFSVIFGELKLGAWVKDSADVDRYQQAHEVARQFCREVLNQSSGMLEARQHFRNFYQKSKF